MRFYYLSFVQVYTVPTIVTNLSRIDRIVLLYRNKNIILEQNGNIS